MPDHKYHSFHGVNKNGNVGTLLYVDGNEKGKYRDDQAYYTIADLTEKFIEGKISFDEALQIVQTQKIVYAPDATMLSMLSDQTGRVLIIEPGIGYRLEKTKYSLITNYSLLNPEITKSSLIPGDNRFEKAKTYLDKQDDSFTVSQALHLLDTVKQTGIWATRVSFVYSVNENRVFYVLDNDFKNIKQYQL